MNAVPFEHLDIRIRGMVQGVCFRAAACAQARAFGVRGFVRNEPDGSVYIEAEGEPASLAKFTAWCHHGPPAAEIEAVETDNGKLKDHAGFTVRF